MHLPILLISLSFFKRVSCEGSFSPHGFHLYIGCQRVIRMYF